MGILQLSAIDKEVTGEEFSGEKWMTNEVILMEYTGGGKKRTILKQDRFETGKSHNEILDMVFMSGVFI